jgi:hypothetical protein
VPVRPPFDGNKEFVAARGFTFAGTEMVAGDPFKKDGADMRRVRIMYEGRFINFAPDQTAADDGPEDPVKVNKITAGTFEVTAPWLDEPVKARGPVKAEAAAAEIREAGPPLGWIEGGTETTLTGGDGGWYEVNAPWLLEAEKVQGRDKAEARQREIHDAGEPDAHHGVTLIAGENGWYEIVPEWGDAEKIHGEEAARVRAAEIRAEGKPEPEPEASPVTIDEGAVGGEAEGLFVVAAPWIADDDRELFDTREAAEARAAELREAGPPEGWEARAETE